MYKQSQSMGMMEFILRRFVSIPAAAKRSTLIKNSDKEAMVVVVIMK